MNGSKIKAICFDYYGTLVDVGQPFFRIKEWFAQVLEKEKKAVVAETFYLRFSKQRAKYLTGTEFMSGYSILEKSYTEVCKKFNVPAYLAEFCLLVEDLFSNPKAFGYALETLSLLNENYRVALITNADEGMLYKNIEKQGFHFDFVIASEEVRCNKPDHEIFKIALKKLCLQPNNVAMIGDSMIEDMLPARELGFQTIWINRNSEEISKKDITIHSLKELLQYV